MWLNPQKNKKCVGLAWLSPCYPISHCLNRRFFSGWNVFFTSSFGQLLIMASKQMPKRLVRDASKHQSIIYHHITLYNHIYNIYNIIYIYIPGTRKHLGKVPFWRKGTFFHPSRELFCWRKNPVWRPEACFWRGSTNCAAILGLANSCHDSCCTVDAHAAANILGAAANFLAATAASYARFYHSVFTSRWFARSWRQGRMAALVWIAVWTCLRSFNLPPGMTSGWRRI